MTFLSHILSAILIPVFAVTGLFFGGHTAPQTPTAPIVIEASTSPATTIQPKTEKTEVSKQSPVSATVNTSVQTTPAITTKDSVVLSASPSNATSADTQMVICQGINRPACPTGQNFVCLANGNSYCETATKSTSPQTYTLPSGAVVDGSGNVITSAPQQAQKFTTPSGAVVDGNGSPILVPLVLPPPSFVRLKINGDEGVGGTVNVSIQGKVCTTTNAIKCPSVTISWDSQGANWPGCTASSSNTNGTPFPLFSTKTKLDPSGSFTAHLINNSVVKITCPTDDGSVSDSVTVNLVP